MEVAIVTTRALLADGAIKDRDGWHIKNRLERENIHCEFVAWEDGWLHADPRVALISSTWNYQEHPEKFLGWLMTDSMSNLKLLNDLSLVQWNMHKQYLIELKNANINIPDTYILSSIELLSEARWRNIFQTKSAIIKPAISASASGTLFIDDFRVWLENHRWQNIHPNQDIILQPFLQSIQDQGEISLIFINGTFTHAKKKIPKQGDFRVQREFGGQLLIYHPNEIELQFAQSVMDACTELHHVPVYARVDICEDNDGSLALMELELIEPELWLESSPTATEMLIAKIRDELAEKTGGNL